MKAPLGVSGFTPSSVSLVILQCTDFGSVAGYLDYDSLQPVYRATAYIFNTSGYPVTLWWSYGVITT